MKKRIVTGLAWFYVTWCAWGVLAYLAGIPVLPGPMVGFVVAALITWDPSGRIWGVKARQGPVVASKASIREPA